MLAIGGWIGYGILKEKADNYIESTENSLDPFPSN